MNIDNEILENLAEHAKEEGDNNLAILLHVFLGARHANVDYELAVHCQNWSRMQLEAINQVRNRRNN